MCGEGLCSDDTAIVYGDLFITYGQLSDKIAERIEVLNKRQIQHGVIGVMLSRTPEYIYWILAILASGCAFVPVNQFDSEEKKEYIFQNSNMDFCLTDEDILTTETPKEYGKFYDPSKILDDEDKLAYIMYTSGTTGLPKGVMISRKALRNFTGCFLPNEIKHGDLVFANTTFTFDISLLEIVLSLTRGATVFLSSDLEQKNPRAVVNILKKNEFDWVQFTPSYLSMLIEYSQDMSIFKNVKNMIIGGERITKSLARVLCDHTKCNLYNAYGPTEATIWTHVGNLRDPFVNVGTPISCAEEYIFDPNGNITDEGVLWLGGQTVALGYINNKELTEMKFRLYNSGIIYETGDLCRKKDGKLEILGRIDNQVKICGRRIELEEIENTIVDKVGIMQCVVLLVEGDLVLCTDNDELTIADVRKKLINKLDTVFIPKRIFALKEFPLMTNGKINRRKVEEMYMEQSSVEEKVLGVMREFVVGDFSKESVFGDLGISSIEYIAMVVKLEKAFNIEFDEGALTLNRFSTVTDMIDYVQSRLAV